MRIYEEIAEHLAESFGALSHPLRLRLVRVLMRRPVCVCRLAVALDAPQPTISRNLAVLRRAGIVRRQQAGTFVRYALSDSLDGAPLKPLYDLVAHFVPDAYDAAAVDAELARRGIAAPP